MFAYGVSEVLINGVEALRNGNPTGAHSGRLVRGPRLDRLAGWRLPQIRRRLEMGEELATVISNISRQRRGAVRP